MSTGLIESEALKHEDPAPLAARRSRRAHRRCDAKHATARPYAEISRADAELANAGGQRAPCRVRNLLHASKQGAHAFGFQIENERDSSDEALEGLALVDRREQALA